MSEFYLEVAAGGGEESVLWVEIAAVDLVFVAQKGGGVLEMWLFWLGGWW